MKQIPVTIPCFSIEEREMVDKALSSGWVAQGPMVAEFEKAVAAHEGVKNGIATTSCTTALHLALLALGLKAGMDVIAPSFTFVATANSAVHTGAEPVLVDIDRRTYNIDPEKVIELIEKKYESKDGKLRNKQTGNVLWGIIAVHQFGLCCDIPAINGIAGKYGLKVLEDAACAVGARIGDVHEGGFGNASCLSFHPRKSITTGEGGMILTDDDDLAARLRAMRTHGASVPADARHSGSGFLLPEFNEVGYNYRMNDIQAAVGLAQARKIDGFLDARRRKAHLYDKLIAEKTDCLITPYVPENYYHTYQSYVCMLNGDFFKFKDTESAGEFRNRLLAGLEAEGIATRQGTHAVHTLGYYKNKYSYLSADFPNAFSCDKMSISLPLYVQMSEDEQNYVIEKIASLITLKENKLLWN